MSKPLNMLKLLAKINPRNISNDVTPLCRKRKVNHHRKARGIDR
ncbi:hypothetical protein [Bradyrhizobium sp. NC92]|nr:hypothetical protein [Bradyrhizobium sp. NC92]UWU67047.1 hypothetical protein N2602_27885 [Bradyrhizobium sp. NC92]